MKNKISKKIVFLLVVLGIYLAILIFDKELFLSSSKFFLNTILKIIPAFALVFVLMSIANYFITPQKVLNFSKRKGSRKWFLMSFAGIISTGPPYLWFPLLSKLRKQGLSEGLITTYLYNRAIAIAFIPLLIFYFSAKYAIILYILITASALIQGKIMNKLFHPKSL